MEIDMSEPLIRVHNVPQEYWHIDRTRCSCGDLLETQGQALLHQGETPVDCVTAKCNGCGKLHNFYFDVSGFYGKISEVIRLHQICESIDDDKLKAIISNSKYTPVESAIQAILTAGEEGDVLALDWMEDAIRHARSHHIKH